MDQTSLPKRSKVLKKRKRQKPSQVSFQSNDDFALEKQNHIEMPHEIQIQNKIQQLQVSVQDQLPYPYMSGQRTKCMIFSVISPHFKVFSLNFAMTVVFLTIFIITSLIQISSPESQLLRSCTLFKFKAKFTPSIINFREYYRLILPFFYHSSVAHIIVNFIPITLYGYTVQQKLRWAMYLGFPFSMLISSLASSIVKPLNVSVTATSYTYMILSLKLIFLIRNWNNSHFLGKKGTLTILIGMLTGLALLPVFTDVNVDFTSVLSGYLVGIMSYLIVKQAESKYYWFVRIGVMLGLLGMIGGLVGLLSILPPREDLAKTIVELCK